MLNVASLSKHLDEIRSLLNDEKLDVLALIRGSCIYVRCRVNYENRPDLIPKDVKAVSLEIKQANSKSFIISSIYRPPNSSVETFSKIEKVIQLINNETKSFTC